MIDNPFGAGYNLVYITKSNDLWMLKIYKIKRIVRSRLKLWIVEGVVSIGYDLAFIIRRVMVFESWKQWKVVWLRFKIFL